MKYIVIGLALCIGFTACKQKTKEEKAIPISDGSLKVLTLPDGWTIMAPQQYYVRNLQGIDTRPAEILSDEDSIHLSVTGLASEIAPDSCSLENSTSMAKYAIENQKLNLISWSETKLAIDTIDQNIAVIARQETPMSGLTYICIFNCKQKSQLEIFGMNLSPEKEKTVLDMFKTLKLSKQNKDR
ncbi:MAG TPA: hypothetical protein P5158_13500 [Chitinophagaceae bacterium]|nr:hypothetical protein [Chitinophagaceae bacterium]